MIKFDVKVEKLKNSEVEITGSIPFEELEKFRKEAVEKAGAGIKIDGFREGKIPEKILIEKIGEMAILNEMAEITFGYAYVDILLMNKIDAITSPQVTITKLAKDNPFEFKVKVAVMPKFELADYKKIAKKEMEKKTDSTDATEEELDKTIEQIQKSQKHIKEDGAEVTEKDLEKDLPELNDEFVKKLGDFKDVEDFKNKLKENIKHEKEHKQKESRRLAILENIIKETEIDLPEILVDSELRKMIAEMRDSIGRMGLNFEKYLEQIKKTEDDLRKEWRADAENRVKGQLVLNQISLDEKILPDETQVKKNVDMLMSQYKNAKRENVEVYVSMMITNDEVFKLLESQKV
ncbi:TPA: hypothetical protein DCZ46_00885 [Candidatus Campbellbacteria bacterium]|nr:MAG: tig, trigger factor, trigger factor [Candidatus Campbellbacteria bacterium GW2011_OD1_34_28]KKP75359.1 MAG: Trigger factor [Candidatus Campbellbacteria bacterium GW2011_GWD2_35_24]KKP76080.1 MAG: trigger factor, trigger factor [Candidatus Campbellbacteria bacterium GW2011_GWC2_35_28]KKP77269.1 MAG: Trigger factor [Candidatus Campbellbacteria bacterium GW2011_GWC1_35_31]KKP79198.1 MAG: Trigger factor [Candidatus Campbellbacteria bacterium GW2011_GWD1_35_49]HAP73811.1 hypothetical protei